MDTDPEDELHEFNIRILIRHPTLDPDLITQRLGIDPDRVLRVGEPFRPPRGDYVGAKNKLTTWSKRYYHVTDRLFFRKVDPILTELEKSHEFIAELNASGGEIEIIFTLPGDKNIGNTLSWRAMERCAALRVSVGVEVFPDY